jgi:hypothetical protein
MGQNMTSTVELSHAMKKMRLSRSSNDGNGGRFGIAHVIMTESPSSPYRKEAGRELKKLANAVTATFADDMPEHFTVALDELGSDGSNSSSELGNGDIVPSVTMGYNDVSASPKKEAAGDVDLVELKPILNVCGNNCDEPLSPDEELTFVGNMTKSDQNICCVNAGFVHTDGGVMDVKKTVVVGQMIFSLEAFEPSDEDLVRYLKKT